MIILDVTKNKYFNRFPGNKQSGCSDIFYEKYKFKAFVIERGFNFQCSLFHSNVDHKKDVLLYPKKMFYFFETSNDRKKLKQEEKPKKPVNFSLFKIEKSSTYFHEILIADTLSRKKRKTNMQIPSLKKITCSYTGKELVSSPTELSIPLIALTFLSGQNCTIIWARKSISSWKLRKNSVIGCKVTLRRKSAFVFLDKLIVYGREGLLEKRKNFLNKSAFCFGVSSAQNFIELQKSDRFSFSSSFSGFSVSIN